MSALSGLALGASAWAVSTAVSADRAERYTLATYQPGIDGLLKSMKKTRISPVRREAKRSVIGDDDTAEGALPPLSEEESARAATLFFERCAGCHGVLRQGATGTNLTPALTRPKGYDHLKNAVVYGMPGGMPNFGEAGELPMEDCDLLAKYLLHEPTPPPEWSLQDMLNSWKVFIPVEDRPKKKMNDLDIDNLFSVTLRDAGKVALIDGHSKKIVQIIDSGYAVHISRLSVDKRYLYIVGRDGRLCLVDLWMPVPDQVAVMKMGHEARSVETSKYPGYENKYAIAGGYWPPHYVLMEGETLKPIRIESTRGPTVDPDQAYHAEPRVAAIIASHYHPEFVVCVKETGKLLLVNYTDMDNLKVKSISAERFLHDGGLDGSHRYFLCAANARDTLAVLDTKTGELQAKIETAGKPHGGRGANFVHKQYGPVWATSHLGADVISLIGTDPENHPEYAWKVCEEIDTQGDGSLFLKTHPNSKNLWLDNVFSPLKEICSTVTVYNIDDMNEDYKIINIAELSGATDGPCRVVQPEYNAAGDEVWLSVWNGMDQESAIVVMDDKTLECKHVIRDPRLITPTGKFNVKNTAEDIY